MAAENRARWIVEKELPRGVRAGPGFGQGGPDDFEQRVRRDGLREHFHHVRVAVHDAVAVPIRRHEDDGHLGGRGVIEQPVADGLGVHVGHGFVEQDQLGLGEVEALEGIGPALRDEHVDVVKILRDDGLREFRGGETVVDDENFLGHTVGLLARKKCGF